MENIKENSHLDCEICRNIEDEEGGWGNSSSETELVPPEVRKLQHIHLPAYGPILLKCPICGTYYDYIQYYEYSPDGNDELERLYRLTIPGAINYLILYELFSELENLAGRNSDCARLVLNQINHSKLKKNNPAFKELNQKCKELIKS